MLKVVGASWFQTRISMYILAFVVIVGTGIVILSEYALIENDGIYSATVLWPRRAEYRVEFWGQGNDLLAIPQGIARAYYKPRILKTGWSIIEIETNPKYPDEAQAYAAGLLEGSLTWQLILHHWQNTVRIACIFRSSFCRKMRTYLRENAIKSREIAAKLKTEDSYWHMVHLFYTQLEGIERGWKLGVQRSRHPGSIDKEDFLWLAMASDLPDLEITLNGTFNPANSGGSIFLKTFPKKGSKPHVAFAQNTASPYSKMLRLIKRYKFGYHKSPAKKAELVSYQSVVMTSYPGALSSQDEHYILQGGKSELIVAGIPIAVKNRTLWNHLTQEHQVLSPPRIMASNRLSTNGRNWYQNIDKHSGTSNRQWIIYQPQSTSLWIVEQIPGLAHAAEHSKVLFEQGFLAFTGNPIFPEIRRLVKQNNEASSRLSLLLCLQKNISTLGDVKKLMSGNHEAFKNYNCSETGNSTKIDSGQVLAFRGDLEGKMQRPFGIVDTIVLLLHEEGGVENFEARAGPPNSVSEHRKPFSWSKTFPNASHIGHPDVFDFDSVTPVWIWH